MTCHKARRFVMLLDVWYDQRRGLLLSSGRYIAVVVVVVERPWKSRERVCKGWQAVT